MKRLCDALQERIAERANAANQMMLAVYRSTNTGDVETLSYECLFYVTRNMLDPAWHLTLNYTARSRQPVLTRNQAAFEFILNDVVQDILTHFKYFFPDEIHFVPYMWVYTQGRQTPLTLNNVAGTALRNIFLKQFHRQEDVHWTRDNINEFNLAKEQFRNAIMGAVEVLVATA